MTYLNIRIEEEDKQILKKYADKYRMQLSSSYLRSRLLSELEEDGKK